ncbi:MAG TPA: hypothetical protein VGG28_16390 [Kofleriaceae bacterium]|jgi:hypothetical protein
MTNLISISDLDLAHVTGGIEGQATGELGGGYVAKGQGSFSSGAASRQQALERACTMKNTSPAGKVDTAAVGNCVLDHMYPSK